MTACMTRIGVPPLVRVAAIYALSVPFAWAMTPAPLPWELIATVLTLSFVPLAGLAPWWVVINTLFLPGLVASLEFAVSPWWGFGGLVLLILVYGRIWRSEVPLFFSSRNGRLALQQLLPPGRPIAFLDAGCGDGRVLAELAPERPESRFHGIEQAVGPWLAAWLRCRRHAKNCRVLRGDLWARTLAPYDVVYAFLSPAVMTRLWEKARHEMRPGTLFVSAFAVPDVPADEQIEVGDAVGTQLHVWRMRCRRAQ